MYCCWFEKDLFVGIVYVNVLDDWYGIVLFGLKLCDLLVWIICDDVLVEVFKFCDLC